MFDNLERIYHLPSQKLAKKISRGGLKFQIFALFGQLIDLILQIPEKNITLQLLQTATLPLLHQNSFRGITSIFRFTSLD